MVRVLLGILFIKYTEKFLHRLSQDVKLSVTLRIECSIVID